MSAAAPLNLVILISGRGSNMSAIVRACQAGAIAARPVVISDRPQAAGLASARALGVETAVLAPPRTSGQPVSEQALAASLAAALAARRPDVIALAGFMRILPAELVTRYLGRMLNIHPSLLPAYRGLHTHRRVLAAGEREHGASVHFVTPELDGGPVVLQSRVAVRPGDTEANLAERVLATEHLIYPRALGWFAARRLTWQDGGPWLDGRRLEAPLVEDFRATMAD
jgi:phosphoribosylglycinamide formyltransferase 1